MDLYVVKVSGLPPTKVHYTLRDAHSEYWAGETHPFLYSLHVSPLGKLCGHKGAAYFDSRDLANLFIEHYRPIFDKRDYGFYVLSVEPTYDGVFPRRWLAKTKPKVLEVLGLTESSTGVCITGT